MGKSDKRTIRIDKKEWTDDNSPSDPDPIPVGKKKIT